MKWKVREPFQFSYIPQLSLRAEVYTVLAMPQVATTSQMGEAEALQAVVPLQFVLGERTLASSAIDVLTFQTDFSRCEWTIFHW